MNAEHTTRLRDTVRKMLNISVYLFAMAFGMTASVGVITCILVMVISIEEYESTNQRLNEELSKERAESAICRVWIGKAMYVHSHWNSLVQSNKMLEAALVDHALHHNQQ